jgi:hypothetical protein
MSLEIDPNLDKSQTKQIILAGKSYLVAPLPLRQVLALADLLPKLSGIKPENLRGEMFDPVVDMVARGLKKAYPSVTTDDLLDLPITIAELLAAIPIVIAQAGGRPADAAAGEVAAASPSAAPIGADSSQTS